MKKFYLILTAILFLTLQLQAQTPNALSYQGVARGAAGLVLQNQLIGLRFTIHQGSPGGTVVYQETQTTSTNLLGLFTVAIGNGTPVTGSFANIAWSSNGEYLQVEMDAKGGSAYVNMGTNQFLSVPYAVTANSSASSWNLTGNSNTNGTNYMGTTDTSSLVFKVHNAEVMRVSDSAKNVGIGTSTPDAGAKLDITSSTKGFLMPRLSGNPANAVQGLMYYNTTTGCFMYYTGSVWDAMVCPCPNPLATPGAISGPTTFCPGANGIAYSIAPISNATSYAWTVPASVGTIVSGVGSNAITINTSTSSGTITVAAVNNCGPGNTASLALTAGTATAIGTQPASANVVSGNNATFTVAATGSNLTYQWQVNTGSGFTGISGATNNSVVVTGVTTGMSGNTYNVIVTGTCGTQTSNAATLTVCPGTPATPGSIAGPNPYCPSTTGVVYSVASVTFATSYTWTVPAGVGTVASGGGSNIITVNTSTSAGTISVVASNICATSSASSLALTVGTGTVIGTQPASQTIPSGNAATFTVSATGSSLTYQWQVNTGSGFTGIPGATNSSYNIASTTIGMNGNQYNVVVTGSCGSTTSGNATLTVCGALGTITTISGPTGFCTNTAGLVYSIAPVANATSYSWTVPAGVGTIVSASTNNSITVNGSTGSGTISVTVANPCQTITQTLAVSAYSTTTITSQPVNATGSTTVNFTVGATGGSLGYQWYENAASAGFLPISDGGVYSGATTATLTLTNPTVGMNGNLYEVVVTGACGTTSVTSSSATLTTCTGIPAVKITLTNSGSTTTPANLPVEITGVNFNSYAGNEDANLDNIEFTVGNTANNGGTPVYAWIESGSAVSTTKATTPTSSSTAGIVWVNLGSTTMIAGATTAIYMNFMSSPVMSSSTIGASTGLTGMAPELSGIYGQYDNGALVFSFYDNFAGSALNAANWTTYHFGTGSGTMTINNGITFVTSNGGTETNVITSASTFTGNFFAELYEYNANGSSGGQRSYMPGITMNNATTEGDNIADNAPNNQPHDYSMSFCDGKNGTPNVYCTIQGDYPVNFEPTYTQPSGYNVMGLGYKTGTTDLWYTNYSAVNGGTTSFQPTGNLYYALGMMNQTGSTMGFSGYWSRIRLSTTGAAPTVSIGALTCF